MVVGLSLIVEAHAAGLQLRAGDNGRLIVRGPRSAEPLVRKLLTRKDDVLAALASTLTAPLVPWPVVPGKHHFSIWVRHADRSWPEFIPGYHYDIRQPSKSRGLCSLSKGSNSCRPDGDR